MSRVAEVKPTIQNNASVNWKKKGVGMENTMPSNAKEQDVMLTTVHHRLSLDQVDKWTPESVYPWQVEPTGVESDIRVGYSQTLVHDDGNGHHGYVEPNLVQSTEFGR